MEWGEFFWNERDPVDDGHGGKRYSATWAAVTSFGVFGHHWSHMGMPFPAFAKKIGRDYLLSKIAREVPSDDKLIAEVSRRISESLAERAISKQVAAAAFGAIRDLSDEHSGSSLQTMLYTSDDLSHVGIEWSDVNAMVWDVQAVGFVEKLWPKFVAVMATAPEGSVLP